MPTPRLVAALSKGLGESVFSGSPREQGGRRQHLPGDDRIHTHPFPRRGGRDKQLCGRLNTQYQEAGQAEDTKPELDGVVATRTRAAANEPKARENGRVAPDDRHDCAAGMNPGGSSGICRRSAVNGADHDVAEGVNRDEVEEWSGVGLPAGARQ